MIQPAFEILNQRGTPMFFSDVYANIPTAGVVGRIFIRTDSPYGIYRDNGSSWDQIAGSGGGGISGSGAAGQVTFWSSASAVSGSNNLWWDNSTNKFLVGTNNATGGGAAQITNTTGDDHLRVWGSTSPSIRIDNAVSAATQRFAIGLATATNNFIQGSAAGNICITTASANPLLFGMWQTTNASEVMRISTGSNLLIGSTTDSGEKLQVTGTAKINGATTINAATSGSGGVSLIVTDTNSTVGTTAKFSFQTTDFIINTGVAGTNISNQSRSYIGFLAGSNRLTLGGSNSNSGMTGVNAIGNSDLGNGLGFAIVDVGGQIGQGSGLNFYSQQVSRTTGSIRQSYGAGFSNVDMLFLVSTSSTISEAMRIFGSSRNIGINTTTDAGYKLDCRGTSYFSENISIALDKRIVNANNSGQSVYFGSTGIINGRWSIATGASTNGIHIGSVYSVANSVAILELTSTTQGFLPPRMTTTQINAIVSPPEGLIVYNTTLSHLCCYQAGAWAKFSHTPM